MPSPAIAREQETEAATSGLDFYRTRDDMVRAYQPQTDEERLLVTQIARAWLRLQQFYEFEAKVLQQHDLFDLFTNDIARYKLLTRGRSDAERQWRNSVQMFERARRSRLQAAKAAPLQSCRDAVRTRTVFIENRGSNAIADVYNEPEELTCSSEPRKTDSNSMAGPSS
jgi:hypothetical protein